MLQLPLQSISEPTVAVWPVSDVLMHQGFYNEALIDLFHYSNLSGL